MTSVSAEAVRPTGPAAALASPPSLTLLLRILLAERGLKPDTLSAWYRKLIAKKFDGSKFRESVGRPPVEGGNRASGCANGAGESELGI